MNYEAIDFLDWEVLPSVAIDIGSARTWEEGDWLAYYAGVLVGRVVHCGKWVANLEGELPMIDIGDYQSLRDARLAIALAVAAELKKGTQV